ncbi:MAG: hypothetical protein HQ509_02105, partial [Candidatus Marinimicrobia bacterium]|nr:hypothetical protein [Candidatus Neomarinimicrobiota bacterium]
PCTACHSGNTVQEKHNFSLAESGCNNCHIDVHGSELGSDCEQCHSSRSWQVTRQTFDHEISRFSLLGAHNNISCEECHTEKPMVQFRNISNDCYSCHQIDYASVSSPSHVRAKIDRDCQVCHPASNKKWLPAEFNHEEYYSLTGSHRTIDCYNCHEGLFRGTATDCRTCHIIEYNATGTATYPDAPRHALSEFFAEQCEDCHTTTNWLPVDFDHIITGYPIEGRHVEVTCDQCHGGDQGYDIPDDCHGCHQPGGIAITTILDGDYDHTTHNLPAECELCHTTLNWDQSLFLHESFSSNLCEDCHLIDHAESSEPPHGNENISTDCLLCHEAGNEWIIPIFSHLEMQTGYELFGLHTEVDCELCHQNQIFNSTPIDCQNSICHFDEIDGSNEPNHITHNLPFDCQLCHTELGWDQSLFAHENFTMDNCENCHLIEHTESTDPQHGNNNISTNCVICHESRDDWEIPSFSHSEEQTRYALLGLHVLVDCELCHQNTIFNTTPNTCQANQCHIAHYNGATDPDHILYNYPIQYCEICHDELGWIPSSFSHSVYDACATCHLPDYNATSNPVHDPELGYIQSCETCHTSTDTWEGASMNHTGLTDCVSCHLTNYQDTTDPNHVEKGYSTDCTQCHQSTEDWLVVEVDHSSYTDPCITCHQYNYDAAENPNHVNNEFPTECETCHLSTTVWRTDEYPHTVNEIQCLVCHQSEYDNTTEPDHPTNQFDSDCMICHISTDTWIIGEYPHSLTEIACAACHMPEYTATVDPNHVENNYNLDCTICHLTTTNWNEVNFNHDGITGDQCWNCHAGDFTVVADPDHVTNNYDHDCTTCHNSTTDWNNVTFNHTGITGDQCWNCHAGDFIGVSDPDHAANNYDHDCTICHTSTENWDEVTFNHDNITQACIDCHIGDYQNVTNPNHSAQGYPEACELCHNTTNWEDDFFNHLFPIFSGDHNNEWSTCTAECHIDPLDYVVFSCGLYGVCHDHRQSEMDDEHIGEVTGYVYESGACYECHPNGEEDDDDDGDRRRRPKAKDWRNILKNNLF